jgi:hypothetical protein
MMRHAIIHRALVILAVTALAIVLGCACFVLYAQTDRGRRTIADAAERAVSKAIPGRMTIGRLVSVDGSGEIVVEDVRFLHPDESLILRVKRAAIAFDLSAALRGELGFTHAQVDGGYLLVAARPSGRTGLEEAFDDGEPSQEPDQYLRMQLRRIHVEHLVAEFRPSADHPFRLRNVHGELAIEHRDTKGAHVRLQHIAAEMTEPEFLGERLAIRNAAGWVHGAEVQVLDLNLETELGGGELDGHLAYYDRKKTPVELELEPKRGATPKLASIAIDAQSWFTDTIDVHVR